LSWYAGKRQKNPQGDQKIPEEIAQENQQDFQHRMAVNRAMSVRIDEVVRRQSREGESDGDQAYDGGKHRQ
jgi:hypothetical protein